MTIRESPKLLDPRPCASAFSQMVADLEYQPITAWRTEALQEAVLQATTEWPVAVPAPTDARS